MPRIVFCWEDIWGTRCCTGQPPSSKAEGKGLALYGAAGRAQGPVYGQEKGTASSWAERCELSFPAAAGKGRPGKGAAAGPVWGAPFLGAPRTWPVCTSEAPRRRAAPPSPGTLAKGVGIGGKPFLLRSPPASPSPKPTSTLKKKKNNT